MALAPCLRVAKVVPDWLKLKWSTNQTFYKRQHFPLLQKHNYHSHIIQRFIRSSLKSFKVIMVHIAIAGGSGRKFHLTTGPLYILNPLAEVGQEIMHALIESGKHQITVFTRSASLYAAPLVHNTEVI